MDRVNQKMKKLRGVLENLRSSVQDRGSRLDACIEETLRSEHFQVVKTARHGFPYQPTAIAYDPVQNLLAIGTKYGFLRIFGRPGVESTVRHEGISTITQLIFLVNEGALISICSDDTIHMWTLRQKKPEIVHSLKFQREKITFCHVTFQSKWLFIGTERGNVHVVNIETFTLSGYVINWNKAMDLIRLTHPGPVVHLSDNPLDSNKLLIGFETGAIVLWDLKNKVAESRYTCTETLRSVCWHHEGKQFICSHADGSITLWNSKITQRPHSFLMPHAKLGKDGRPEACKPIVKVDYRTVRNSEPYIIFSGGTAAQTLTPSLTVMHGNNMTVLEMEHPVIDFITLSTTPWNSDYQDPQAIAVLLNNDLVVVDLTTTGYPCFENPYPMDIQESPVTACQYFADCPSDLIPAFYSVGCKNKPAGYSEKEWPIHGGEWGTSNCSYPEIVITGHADGSVKFWDASSVTFHTLYKLKTAKIFDERRVSGGGGGGGGGGGRGADDDEYPFAIQHIYLCLDSRLLCVAGLSHVVLFRFNKLEATFECPFIEVSVVYEVNDTCDINDCNDFPIIPSKQTIGHISQQTVYGNQTANGKEAQTSVHAKLGARKWPAGYQPSLCCLITWIDSEPSPPITSLAVNSRFGLLAFGNECGIAIIDIIQKTCLLSMGTPDLYGSMDPYSRAPRSPKSKISGGGKSSAADLTASQGGPDEIRSPSVEQRQRTYLSPSPHATPRSTARVTSGDTKLCGDRLAVTAGGLRSGSGPGVGGTRGVSGPGSGGPRGGLRRTRSNCSVRRRGPHRNPLDTSSISDDSRIETIITDSSFSRSRSSSLASLENVNKESIDCVYFAEAYTRKTDTSPCPCLWVGTSLGTVLVISLTLSLDGDARRREPVMVSPSGQQSTANLARQRISPTSSIESQQQTPPSSNMAAVDQQFAVICSEKQARVISLPSQTCVYKVKITETSVVSKADVILVRDSPCLACFLTNGHIMTFSLPSLRPLLDSDYIPFPDIRITRTICFSHFGNVVYLCSPSEIQKLSLSTDTSEAMREVQGEMFIPRDMPEAPRQGFLRNLLNLSSAPVSSSVDREELFGESSGKASKGVATYTPGPAGMSGAQEGASAACSDISRAKMLALERGEKLGELDERTEAMKREAEMYAMSANQLKNKFKDKKWYQF